MDRRGRFYAIPAAERDRIVVQLPPSSQLLPTKHASCLLHLAGNRG